MPGSVSSSLYPLLMRLRRDRQGVTAVMTALALTTLFGFAGIGVEVAMWERAQRDMQGAADQAANAAAVAYNIGGHATTSAKAVTAQMGYADGVDGVTVTVNNPPTSGSYTSYSDAFEVLIRKPQPMWFANVIMSTAPTIGVRAVASPQGRQYCIIELDPTSAKAINLQGNPAITTPNCNIKANSSNADAVDAQGSARITANMVSIVGGYQTGGTGTITANSIVTGATVKSDPYASVPNPTSSALNLLTCNIVANVNNGQTTTLTPSGGSMRICGGINVKNGGTLVLNAGTYYIDGGTLTNNGTITGTGVTLVMTSSTGLSYATINNAGGSTINLRAPSSGTYSGLVIFQDRNTPHSVTGNALTGGANQQFIGDLYFPTTPVTYTGNATTSSTTCVRLIAWDITFNGNSGFASNCTGVGVANTADNAITVLE